MISYKSYPRTYRYIKNNFLKSFLYFSIVFILPLIALVIPNVKKISRVFSLYAMKILESAYKEGSFVLRETYFVNKGRIYFVDLVSQAATPKYIEIQILIATIVFLFFVTGKRKGKTVGILMAFEVGGFIINALYFKFFASSFPYTIKDFSELYIRQQICIWIFFVVLYGIGTACLGNSLYIFRISIFILYAVYALLFAFVRYVLFIYILSKYSMFYMFTMYFTFGPLIDCLNLVTSYAIMLNVVIKKVAHEKTKEVWLWS